MYRIDDATAATSLPTPEPAGTEGYFTEGNPAAGTPATNVRGAWLNMIQEELRAIVVAAGITPSKTVFNQVLLALQKLSSPVVGAAKNVAMNVAAGATTGTVTADEIVVGSALGGQTIKLANFSQVISLATVGAGGMDTGTATAGAWLAIYAAYNPTTGARTAFASVEGAAAAPTIYGGANAPAGYTMTGRLAVVPVSAIAGQFAAFSVQDNKCTIAEFTFVSSSTSSSTPGNTSFTSTGVPKSARRIGGSISISNSAAQNSIWKFFADANSTGSKQYSVNTSAGGGGNLFGFSSVALSAAQAIRATAYVAGGSGTMSYILLGSEYEI